MPFAVVGAVGLGVGGILGIGYALRIAAETISRSRKILRKKPQNPPNPPPAHKQISHKQMIENAQRKLNMDVLNDFNFAFCGSQGVGKSFLINTIRMLPPISDFEGEHGSAPISCTECTQEARRYRFLPTFNLPYVALWDLPGFDSEAIPAGSYFRNPNITLYAFDCLILVCGERLKHSDLKLLEEAKEWNMPVLLVVNQCDKSIEGEKRKQIALQNRLLTKEEYRELIDATILQIKIRIRQQIRQIGDFSIYCLSALAEHWAEDFQPLTAISTTDVEDKYDEEAMRRRRFCFEFAGLCERCTEYAVERRLN